MSHRVVTKTEITNADLAKEALRLANMGYREVGNTLRITSGGLSNVTLDLETGDISGDTDYGHTAEKLGALRQFYAEAKCRAEFTKSGVSIDQRSVDEQGRIVLLCRTA